MRILLSTVQVIAKIDSRQSSCHTVGNQLVQINAPIGQKKKIVLNFMHVRMCMCVLFTWSQSFLSAAVILTGLPDVPGGQRQRLYVLQTSEFQHVHVVAVALVPWNEAAFLLFEHVLDDLFGLDLVVHAEEHCDPLAGHIFRVAEQLWEKQCKISGGGKMIFILYLGTRMDTCVKYSVVKVLVQYKNKWNTARLRRLATLQVQLWKG